jgi:fluoroacetyl-CoA thioesterase
MAEPEPDATASATLIVGRADLASAISDDPSDAFPDVLATARLVALMELASARVLGPCLGAGELSVGVAVDVRHTAATPPGATVTARARFVGREGALFLFEVIATDPGGEIGRCRHKRAIVTTARLLEGARRRQQAGDGQGKAP